MKVHYDEDLARHIAPEPCVVPREGQGEASAGVRAGWPLSRESIQTRVPTVFSLRKATWVAASSRVASQPGVVREPSMHARSLFGNREISLLAGGGAPCRSAWGRGQTRSPR